MTKVEITLEAFKQLVPSDTPVFKTHKKDFIVDIVEYRIHGVALFVYYQPTSKAQYYIQDINA